VSKYVEEADPLYPRHAESPTVADRLNEQIAAREADLRLLARRIGVPEEALPLMTVEVLASRLGVLWGDVQSARTFLLKDSRCVVVHVGYSRGSSCLDVKEYAQLHPTEYAHRFYMELIAGNHLCEGCRRRVFAEQLGNLW